jgi:predicted NUDIX family phosphoesterase
LVVATFVTTAKNAHYIFRHQAVLRCAARAYTTAMEFVFVVPREKLFPDSYPHGVLPFTGNASDSETFAEAFEARAMEHGFFVERRYAELTPSLQQIIPYGVVCCGDEILLVKRLKKGGESRLHDKLSIGIGGHINPIDGEHPTHTLFTAATIRELEEELSIEGTFTARAVGVLNDDTNPVGAVHVGLVQIVQVCGSVQIREKDQLEGQLTSINELRTALSEGGNFETWSQLLIDRLDELLPLPVTTLT